jgi:hypoxia-inducible factor 1-alpha inhibitor (HIF hydroxylase)
MAAGVWPVLPESTHAALAPTLEPLLGAAAAHLVSGFLVGEVPRVRYEELATIQRFAAANLPCVVTGARLMAPALERWSPDYLAAHALPNAQFTVFRARTPSFLYWDVKPGEREADAQFRAPSECIKLTFPEFIRRFRRAPRKASDGAGDGAGDGNGAGNGASDGNGAGNGASEGWDGFYYYLQHTLDVSFARPVVDDFGAFDFAFLLALARANGWGPLTSNVLFVGAPSVTTELHFDEQQNVYAQIRGRKRVQLLPPESFAELAVYPLTHPCDRQCQVRLARPDLARFPGLARVGPLETVLEPGDLLLLPAFWFHWLTSLEETVSVNCWFKAQSAVSPLAPDGSVPRIEGGVRITLMRNVEKLARASVKDAGELRLLLLFLADVAPPPPLLPLLRERAASFADTRSRLRAMLLHVLPEEAIGPLFRDIVTGRYDAEPAL